MKVRSALAAAFACLLLTAGAAVAAGSTAGPPGGTVTVGWYPAPGAPGAREYRLFTPDRLAAHPGLVMFLHGCNETAAQAEAATHFDAVAQQDGFLVVYPQQNVTAPSTAPLADGNGVGCWNWFLPADQQRGAGEPATLAGLARFLVASRGLDPDKVDVEGISAGADMAVVLGATYPDVFAAVGVLAGCAFATCADATGELAYAAMGPRARVVPLFVENGSADTVNPLPLAAGLVQSWIGVDNLVLSGRLDGPVARTPSSVGSEGYRQVPHPGSGDLCVHSDSLTCPGGLIGFSGSYPYTVLHYDGPGGCDLIDFWVIQGMEHAHPDAPGDGPYTDPLGPDVTRASAAFFAAHPRNHPCGGRAG